MIQSLLTGGNLINPSAAKLSVSGASSTTNQNYKNLFALYQGLSALSSLAQSASSSTTTVDGESAQQVDKAFQAGVQQVQSFLSSDPFSGFQVFQGTTFTADKTTSAVPTATTANYTGATLYSGPANSVIPAFQGDVQFGMTVTKSSGSQTVVNFNLADMGNTPRTMANVLNYLNGQLQAANVATRFSEQATPGTPQTITAGGKTITLPDSSPNQYALQIQGTTAEQVSFSAPTTDPAVYVGQTSGITSSMLPATSIAVPGFTPPKPDAVQQLVKLDASSTPIATTSANGQVFKQTLGSNVSNVQATATAPDGSVYVLADVTGTTAGQTIQGAQDVALIKYDSAGNVVYTRTLGAASTASGLSLTVSADGSQVAVAGSVTGNLNPGSTSTTTASSASTTVPQGFVTVYDSQGDEQWTQQIAATGGSGAGVQANAVAFGSGGMVYVAGQVDGAIPGGRSSGGPDGFVEALQATSVPLNDGSGQSQWVVTPTYTNQFGSSGVNRATGLAVSGSSVYVSSVQNGDAVVQQFGQSGTNSNSLTPLATRDLGSLGGGGVAGVAINSDGSVIVAGSTSNGALNAGTVTQPYVSGEEAFVASLAPDLQPAATDTLTYVGSGATQTATAVTVSGGQVYIAGKIATNPIPGTDQTSGYNGYAAAVDPQTGQVTWTQSITGMDNQDAPSSIAVSQTGSSVLDQLGLPSGSINQANSQLLVANTSVRAGDKFYVKSGANGPLQAVTISSNDTYKTLAAKIERASGYSATATVAPGTGGNVLSITQAATGQQVQLLAGPDGQDALGSLGLTEGVVSSKAAKATALAPTQTQGALPATTSIKNGYSLQLPSDMNLNSPTAVKQAQSALANAISVIQGIYQNMTTPPPSAAANSSGAVPQYLIDQLANYQAGLARLTGA